MNDEKRNISWDESINCLKPKGMSASEAFTQIQIELEEDGLTDRDLGSFTTIKMLPEADILIQKTLGKNMVNKNEYPKTSHIRQKLIKTIANILHLPNPNNAFGSSTAGSSEAIFMAILAAKWRWRKRKIPGNPNIVLCSNAHICWLRSSKFLDVTVREIPLQQINKYPIQEVLKSIDQNTICVVTIMGCTYLGSCDPIYKLNRLLKEINTKNNWDIGIHVDAAIGGFIMPFIDQSAISPWDFQLSQVKSINLSGHKFGMVYPGLGWIIFRSKEYFPSELISTSKYLIGVSETFTLNFSRSAAFVLAQYFNFLHYGLKGYRKKVEDCIHNSIHLSQLLINTGIFNILSESNMPMVVFTFKNNIKINTKDFTEILRPKQWMLPYYKLSGKLKTTVMRVVIRNDMTYATIKQLVETFVECYKIIDNNKRKQAESKYTRPVQARKVSKHKY